MTDEPWQATIERTGRWSWRADYHSGITGLQHGSVTFGWRARQRIRARARRKIDQLNREDRWSDDADVIS